MKPLIYTAKTALGITLGIGCSVVFVTTMDDIIYSNLKRQVILPFQLARIKGDGRIAQETVQGTGRFMRDMAPHGLSRMSAKDLILKDSDYSTPQDHYFSHLQKMKQPDVVKEVLEDKVISDLNIDKQSLKQLLIEDEVKPVLSALQQFDVLTPQQKDHLAKQSGFQNADQVRLLLAIPEETFQTKRSPQDSKILNQITVKNIIDMPFTNTNKAQFEGEFPDLVKLEAKPDVNRQTKIERRRKQKQREQELSQILDLQTQGIVDPEQVLKIASEGGEIQAVDVTKQDLRRLQRLKSKAAKQVEPAEIIDEGQFK